MGPSFGSRCVVGPHLRMTFLDRRGKPSPACDRPATRPRIVLRHPFCGGTPQRSGNATTISCASGLAWFSAPARSSTSTATNLATAPRNPTTPSGRESRAQRRLTDAARSGRSGFAAQSLSIQGRFWRGNEFRVIAVGRNSKWPTLDARAAGCGERAMLRPVASTQRAMLRRSRHRLRLPEVPALRCGV